ncbi:hypothetical protein DU508_07205 [Pedobacter chinensis]|uniref:Uncharacterized protein n=1 Tax=Pedobacter chinensis TaxID=2282421 RepID=A0A369Q3S2_9SPHI|nr:hypothetical protein DU508_07205 [Pedobacter chinensis]
MARFVFFEHPDRDRNIIAKFSKPKQFMNLWALSVKNIVGQFRIETVFLPDCLIIFYIFLKHFFYN